jgi:hypothetical protein
MGSMFKAIGLWIFNPHKGSIFGVTIPGLAGAIETLDDMGLFNWPGLTAPTSAAGTQSVLTTEQMYGSLATDKAVAAAIDRPFQKILLAQKRARITELENMEYKSGDNIHELRKLRKEVKNLEKVYNRPALSGSELFNELNPPGSMTLLDENIRFLKDEAYKEKRKFLQENYERNIAAMAKAPVVADLSQNKGQVISKQETNYINGHPMIHRDWAARRYTNQDNDPRPWINN